MGEGPLVTTSSHSGGITYKRYKGDVDLGTVAQLVDCELSEPYTVYTYRYFLHQWPTLCYIAYDGEKAFGTVVCKMDVHRERNMRGYVAMLVVDKAYRGKGAGSELVKMAIREMMMSGDCQEVVLEAEVTNMGALRLYQALGFIRDKRLHGYYLNGVDAYRLKLLLPPLTEEEDMGPRAMQLNSLEASPSN